MENSERLAHRFVLSSEECELLLEFESSASLQELALKIGRDHSVVARTLKAIAERVPVVDKKAGKWVLTDLGRQLNDATKVALNSQRSVLNSQSALRIGTNREFAARVLALDLKAVQKLFPNAELTINSYERGTESALLQRLIDIGIDCERPNDPEISYRLVTEEPIVAVASKEFVKKHKAEIVSGKYLDLPHLLCERLHPDKIFAQVESRFSLVARFNDIATARAACVHGLGWALLPTYAILEELHSGSLQQIGKKEFGKSKYGIRWLRGRPYLQESAEKMIQWLQAKNLGYSR